MTQPSAEIRRGAQSAMERAAGRTTPFIFNDWYVAGLGEEFGRTLLKRTLLGRSLVFCRTVDGRPVAMDNRCPHRSYPLSAGTLDGDTVVCGYHGLRFDAKGDCVEVPALGICPPNIGVRTYTLVERGPFVWIWMGEPGLADPARLPESDWVGGAGWGGGTLYFHLQGSYVSLHENLLETSHLSFLHANTIGSPDYVKAPTTTEIGDGEFVLNRVVDPTQLPPTLARLTGLEGVATVTRLVRNEFLSPGYYQVKTRLYDGALPEAGRPEFRIRVAHAPTPETLTTTHYFIYVGRDFGIDDPASLQGMVDNFRIAFDEDVVALALQEEMQAEAGEALYEISLPTDALSMAMRRYLKARADSEQLAGTV